MCVRIWDFSFVELQQEQQKQQQLKRADYLLSENKWRSSVTANEYTHMHCGAKI